MLNDTYMLRSYADHASHDEVPPIEEYLAQGFRRHGAERWRDHWIPPHMAREYADLGLSPVDAEVWAVVPELVEAYLNVGVDQYAVWSWVTQGVMPHDVPSRRKQRAAVDSDACPLAPPGMPCGCEADPQLECDAHCVDGPEEEQSWPATVVWLPVRSPYVEPPF